MFLRLLEYIVPLTGFIFVY